MIISIFSFVENLYPYISRRSAPVEAHLFWIFDTQAALSSDQTNQIIKWNLCRCMLMRLYDTDDTRSLKRLMGHEPEDLRARKRFRPLKSEIPKYPMISIKMHQLPLPAFTLISPATTPNIPFNPSLHFHTSNTIFPLIPYPNTITTHLGA
jgi:hypothetical protein